MEIAKFTISINNSFMEGRLDLISLRKGQLVDAYNKCIAM